MTESQKKKKEANFLIQGSILAIASVIVRLIGIVYRIPVTNILGDGGNAAYSNAYAIYSLIWMVASFGIPTAVSKMVAERIGNKQQWNANRVFVAALLFATVVGGIAFSILFFGAGFLANDVYKRPEIRYALMILAPTVWISTFLGAFRGYFQGHGTMVPTAISQIIEQVINAIMSVVGALLLCRMGQRLDLLHSETFYQDALGAAGGTVGTFSGALAGLIVCMVIYRLSFSTSGKPWKRLEGTPAMESYRTLLQILVLMILPITLNSAIYTISGVLDSFMFSNYASVAGMTADAYEISWNAYEGKYHLLTHVPLAFATALSAAAVPNLSRTLKTTSPAEITKKIRTAIRFAMLIAIPSAVGLAVLSKPILQLLFASTPKSNALAASLLCVGGITVVMYSFSTITNGVLQGIGKVSEPAKNAAVSLAAHLVILIICMMTLPNGIYAVVLADIIFGLMMNLLNYRSMYQVIRFRMEWKQTFILPFISSVLMGAAAWGVYQGVYMAVKSNSVAVLAAIAAAVLVYAAGLLLTGTLKEEDLKAFPKGALLVRLGKKTHLLRK